jgi:hypothetical protein
VHCTKSAAFAGGVFTADVGIALSARVGLLSVGYGETRNTHARKRGVSHQLGDPGRLIEGIHGDATRARIDIGPGGIGEELSALFVERPRER